MLRSWVTIIQAVWHGSSKGEDTFCLSQRILQNLERLVPSTSTAKSIAQLHILQLQWGKAHWPTGSKWPNEDPENLLQILTLLKGKITHNNYCLEKEIIQNEAAKRKLQMAGLLFREAVTEGCLLQLLKRRVSKSPPQQITQIITLFVSSTTGVPVKLLRF